MLNSFPQLMVIYNELEIVRNQQEQNECLHGVASSELTNVRVLNKQGQYLNLKGQLCSALTEEQLAHLVTAYLLNEGHCCLGKIKTLSTSQAFNLLGL